MCGGKSVTRLIARKTGSYVRASLRRKVKRHAAPWRAAPENCLLEEKEDYLSQAPGKGGREDHQVEKGRKVRHSEGGKKPFKVDKKTFRRGALNASRKRGKMGPSSSQGGGRKKSVRHFDMRVKVLSLRIGTSFDGEREEGPPACVREKR